MKQLLKNIRIIGIILPLFLISYNGIASAKANIDSLHKELEKHRPVSQQAEIYKELVAAYLYNQPEKSLPFAKKGLKLSRSLSDTIMTATFYGQIGVAYLGLSDYSKSSKYLFKALKPAEQANDKELLSFLYNNLGNMFRHTGNTEKAATFYKKGLELRKELKDSTGIAHSYNNLGITEMMAGNYEAGMRHWKNSLKIKLASGDEENASSTMSNMAMYYADIGKTQKALNMHNKAFELEKKYGDYRMACITLSNIGSIYYRENNFPKAFEIFEKAMQYAKKSQSKNQKSVVLKYMAMVQEKLGNYKTAYNYHLQHAALKDSILNEESQKQLSEIETKYETEKKELEIENLKKRKALQQAEIEKKNEEIKRDRIQKIGMGGGLLVTLLMAFIIFRSYKRKKRDNNLIQTQKEQVEKQKELVEEKNGEIIDSITYSKRLQNAILPPENQIAELLPQSFILYIPKDIVAGDFYWLEKQKDEVICAAADCTGHGVPGAMVSVICHNALNRAVNELGLSKPSEILDKVSELVEQTFEKSEETVKDGMDIALCSLNSKKMKLQYAGANNPLWIFRKGITNIDEIEVIKADKQPVGNHFQRSPFTNHIIQLNKGDSVYFFSDGFQDQFGGPKGKKLKPKKLKKILLSIKDKPMKEQKEILEMEFENWKGSKEQLDDVCLMGIRV